MGAEVDADVQTQFVTAGSLLYSVEHRPWLPPDAPWLLSQSLNDLLFAHFAIDKATLRRLVPDVFTLDLYDGIAWLTISPFSSSHARPKGIPPLPGLSFFSQMNVRTYVTVEGKPGLYYFSADASNLSAVWFARVFFRMQYWHASIEMKSRNVETLDAENREMERAIHFRSKRLHGPSARDGAAKFEAVYSAASRAERARRGSLDEFLTERYCMYSWNRRRIYRTEIHHQPWPLQQASTQIIANSVADPLGLSLPTEPDLCHFSRSLKMLVWAPERVILR